MPKNPITVKSVADARRELPAILKRFSKDGTITEPVVLGNNHKPEAVLLPYGQWERQVNLLEEPQIAAIISERSAVEISELFEIPLELARVVVEHADQDKPLSMRHIERLVADLQASEDAQRAAQLAAVDSLANLDLDVSHADPLIAAALAAANAVPAAELDRVLDEATEQLRSDLRSSLAPYTREQALAAVLADFERTHGAFTAAERARAARLFDHAQAEADDRHTSSVDPTSNTAAEAAATMAAADTILNTEAAVHKQQNPADGDIEGAYPEEDREEMEKLEGNPG